MPPAPPPPLRAFLERSRPVVRWLWPAFALGLFLLALIVLNRQLGQRSWSEVVDAFVKLPAPSLLGAAVVTVLAYVVLTGYDTLALHHLRRPLRWRDLAQVSFIAYAFSYNVGMNVASAGAIRYRFYSSYGLTALDVTRIMAFTAMTTWVGYGLVGGLVLTWGGFPLPIHLAGARWLLQALGVVLFLLMVCYLVVAARRREPLMMWGWQFPLPGLKLGILQVGVSALEWLLAAGVVYLLLPPNDSFGYLDVLGVYSLAAIAGLLSHVPGGLGVVEGTVVLSLEGLAPPHQLLAGVLAFRIAFFIAPLIAAAVLFAGHELHRVLRARRGAAP